mgnify:CR=1 FL=1
MDSANVYGRESQGTGPADGCSIRSKGRRGDRRGGLKAGLSGVLGPIRRVSGEAGRAAVGDSAHRKLEFDIQVENRIFFLI